MPVSVSDADLAFTYAWWLTGDPEAAEAAVRRAWTGLSENQPATQQRLNLLAAVRASAIDQPTMCPASELAVLHDAQGLDLPDAAMLACIDVDDARVELAHGRLEALLETVREPFLHPERLGGLAVGNPPDIAHARQCENCAGVERLLREGRDALRDIPAPVTPAALLALLAPPAPVVEAAPEPETDLRVHSEQNSAQSAPAEEGEGDAAADPPRVLQFDDTLAPLTEQEIEEAARKTESAPARRRNRLLPAVVVLAIILLIVTVVSALRPGGGSGGPDADEVGFTESTDQTETVDQAAPPGFAIEALGMLRRGEFVPAGPDLVLTTTDRVRIAVRYAGATEGVALAARWNIDGKPFKALKVALSSTRSMHVFTAPVPADGWPTGLHHVVITVGGAIVAGIDFRVV